MARCKLQAQNCRLGKAELEERLIEQLIIGTRERKVQEVLLRKDDKLKLDKAMDLARTREATVSDMKSLVVQGASTVEKNIDAVRQNSNPQSEKRGLHHGKRCPPYGTRCGKCRQYNHWVQVCRNKQVHDKQSRPPSQRLSEGEDHKTRQSKARYIQLMKQALVLRSCYSRASLLTVPTLA